MSAILPNGTINSLPVEYYVGLVTSEYSGADSFLAFLRSVLSIADDISNCLQSISPSFDIDYAVGVQLDSLGTIIGVSRVVPFQPSGGVSPVLDGNTYRILLKATAFNNRWDGTISSLYSFWAGLFSGGNIIIIDNQDMSANIALTGTFNSIIQDLITNGMIVPRPEGVLYNLNTAGLPFFGADRNDAYVAGADIGHAA